MNRKISKFSGILLLALGLVFGAHLLLLHLFEKPLFEHKIVWTYLVNYALAVLVLLMVERSIKAESAQAGFVFIAGSGLKFLVFFLVFYPSYKANGEMETIEFITFFVPYSLCLILEVAYLSKQLNQATFKSKNDPKKNS